MEEAKSVPVIASEIIKVIKDVVSLGENWNQTVSERRKETLLHRRNRYVSSLLAPLETTGLRTWDMLIDGINDQQIKSFQSRGDPNKNEAVAAAWVSSMEIMRARDKAFSSEIATGLPINIWSSVLDDWSMNDFKATKSLQRLEPYLRTEGAELYDRSISLETLDFVQRYYGNKEVQCSCWSLLTVGSLTEEKSVLGSAKAVPWGVALDTCTKILALAEAEDNSYCLLGTDRNEIFRIGPLNNVQKHTSQIPNLNDDMNQIDQKPGAVKAVLLIAEALRDSTCNPVTSIRMAIHLLGEITLRDNSIEKKEFLPLSSQVLTAVKTDIELCNRFMSVIKRRNEENYYCDLKDRSEYKVVVGTDAEKSKHVLEPIEITQKIQKEILRALSTANLTVSSTDFPWKPYLCNHLALEGVKAVRDAHLNATRKGMRNKESANTRCLVSLSVLVFRHKVNPSFSSDNILDPTKKFKTSYTKGERLSAISVPFSNRLCIYNHDSKNYEVDEFTQQPFCSKECCFLEPMYVLWESFSSSFSQDGVKTLVNDLHEDYTTIFRLNDRTFNLIMDTNTEIKMSTIKEKCSSLKGTDKFRAHVLREVLYRIIKTGAQKAAGASGKDCIFNELTRWNNFGSLNALKVRLDAKTNLLGVEVKLIKAADDAEAFYPPSETQNVEEKRSAIIELGRSAFLLIYGSENNYQAVLREGSEAYSGEFERHELGKVLV